MNIAISTAANDFSSDKSQPGGLSVYCKTCKSAYAKCLSQKHRAKLETIQLFTCTSCKQQKPADWILKSEAKCLDCNSKYKLA